MFWKKTNKTNTTDEHVHDYKKSNRRLLMTLASVPVAIVVIVLLLGSNSFFGNAYKSGSINDSVNVEDNDEDVTSEMVPSKKGNIAPAHLQMDTAMINAIMDTSNVIPYKARTKARKVKAKQTKTMSPLGYNKNKR